LSGLLIGNGWIAPVEQYNAYLDYAYKAGLIQRGSDNAQQLESIRAECMNILGAPDGEHVSVAECEKLLTEILRLSQKDGRCVNMYDVRLLDDYPSCGMAWPPDLTNVTPYLRRTDVVAALHINKAKSSGWTECGGAVGANFDALKSIPTIHMLPGILEQVPIVLFSGDQDLICNHLGTEEMIHNMEWGGGKGFELSPGTWAPRRVWTFEGEPAGFYQEARNLTYILFYNSSHMVPFDYARRTRDMLDRFIGVDIASIGGAPSDSRIDGEKGLETSVGGHPNSTSAEQAEKDRLEEAKWAAYYKSGEVALIVVIILAGGWGWYVWRDRRRRAGYQGLFGESSGNLVGENGRFARHKLNGRDVEAADFDESELDDIHVVEPQEDGVEENHSLGEISSEVEDRYDSATDGHTNEKASRRGPT
jgi:carboxypeptidase D